MLFHADDEGFVRMMKVSRRFLVCLSGLGVVVCFAGFCTAGFAAGRYLFDFFGFERILIWANLQNS